MIDFTAASILSAKAATPLEEEVIRNVRVIVSTIKGQVALDRDFGMDPDLLDMPIPDAESFFLVQAMDQVRIYEPRAIVQTVEFESDMNGKLSPKVVIEIVREFT